MDLQLQDVIVTRTLWDQVALCIGSGTKARVNARIDAAGYLTIDRAPGRQGCPDCGQELPQFKGGVAITCQNDNCRFVFDQGLRKIGRFNVGYSQYEALDR